MNQLAYATLYFLVCFRCASSCPFDCFCENVVIDSEIGEYADCSHASLESLPSISEGALILDFSGNYLEVIPHRINLLHNLRELDFSSNRLGYMHEDEGLPDFLFSTLKNLKILDLSDNYLSTLSPNTFNGLVRLEKLDLYGNRITHLPLGMLQLLPSTAAVCLGDNEWNCSNCQFHETLEWYQSDDRNHETDVCNREEPSCFSPSSFKGRRFTEVSLEEIPECVEEKVLTSTSPFISTSTGSQTEMSSVFKRSLYLVHSRNPSTTTAHSSTILPEVNKYPGTKLTDHKTAKLVMVSPHQGFISGKEGYHGGSQLFIAVAIVVMGVITLTMFLVFSMMVWKMQRKHRQVDVSNLAGSPLISDLPFLQSSQLMAMGENYTENSLNPTYEEIPFNDCSNDKNEHFEVSNFGNEGPETQFFHLSNNGKGHFPTKVGNPYNTPSQSLSYPMIAKLASCNSKSTGQIAVSDSTGATALFASCNDDNDLSQSTPYMVMHSPKEKIAFKDLYVSFEN